MDGCAYVVAGAIMEINVRKSKDVTIVELAGDMDGSTAPVAQAQIVPLAESGVKIIMDMSKVPYMSSAGLRMLLVLYRTVKSRGGNVVLVGLAQELSDTMALTGFLDFFEHYDTVDQGMMALA
jgi:anti-sigma B factor antagonist